MGTLLMAHPKAYCTQFTDRECREEDCCMRDWIGKDGKIYFSDAKEKLNAIQESRTATLDVLPKT